MVPLPQCGPASEQSAQVHAPRPGLTREEQQGCSKQSGTEGTAHADKIRTEAASYRRASRHGSDGKTQPGQGTVEPRISQNGRKGNAEAWSAVAGKGNSISYWDARSFGCTNWKRVSQSRTDAEYKDCERYRLRLVAVLH
jgi:hypothetical protein